MDSYQIRWKRSASKELKTLPKNTVRRILDAVEDLSSTPYPRGVIKLAGSQHTYRLRTGNYRVIYTVESDVLIIEIVRVGHRRDVYR